MNSVWADGGRFFIFIDFLVVKLCRRSNILLRSKRQYVKNKNVGTQLINPSMTLCPPLFLIVRVFVSIWVAKNGCSLQRINFIFTWLLAKKYISLKVARVLRYLIWEQIWCANFSYIIYTVMFMVGYYNEFTVVRRQILGQSYFKDSWLNNLVFHVINRCLCHWMYCHYSSWFWLSWINKNKNNKNHKWGIHRR